ncbi:MAG: glycosyltransferase family 4 protein [Patescibacteria group bacterium]|nr:glycosyltransferase family 4 protein [Patescibacteria group bacterium]
MRIGIDCRTILNPSAGEKAGIAHYTYHLVKALLRLNRADEFMLFFDHRAKNIYRDFLEPNTVIRFFTYSEYKKYLPYLYSHILAASNLTAEKLDIYHSPANVVPLGYKGKYVVTIHDLAIYRDPGIFPSRQGFSIKYLVPKSLNRARKVIAVSESTKKDVLDFFKIPDERVQVIYEGVDHQRFNQETDPDATREYLRQKYRIKKSFLLFVGTLEPRKNLIRLLEAVYLLSKQDPQFLKQYQLVLAGSPGWLYKEIYEEVKSRHLESCVVFTGYLPAEDVPKFYATAESFVYPSLYEGFGLPILEAFSAGVPVVTSNTSALAEVSGGAAILVDPLDIDGLARAVHKTLRDLKLREDLKARGRKRASEFSWEKCAQETMELYRQVNTQS